VCVRDCMCMHVSSEFVASGGEAVYVHRAVYVCVCMYVCVCTYVPVDVCRRMCVS